MKRLSKRKCEMWISNNKVLVGSNSKKPHARNPNFETEETKLLISLWGDPKVQKTLITTHKKHPVILRLAEQMREHGYYRSADEINTRIKNLKCFYNRIKKDVEMGIITEPTWKHYKAMEEIVTRPVFGNRVQQPHLQHLLNQADTQNLLGDFSANNSDMADGESVEGLRPEDLLSVKEDDEAEMDFDDASLVPKDEPVDIDEMENDTEQCEVDDVDDIFPKLSQYLQLGAATSKKNSSKAALIASIIPQMDIKLSPRSSPGIVEQMATAPNAQLLSALSLTPTVTSVTSVYTSTKPATTITSASSMNPTQTPSTPQHQNKISLVPTNVLMKQPAAATPAPSLMAVTPKPPQTTHLTPHNQPQSISFGGEQYVCANTVSNGKSVYTSAQKDGQPMKVLLVNTNIQQKPPPTVSIPAGNLVMSNAAAAAAATANLIAASNAQLSYQNTISSTPTMVSSGGATSGAVTTTSSSTGPVMPKPKLMPPSGIAPPPPVYSTRSTRAKAIHNLSNVINEVASMRRSTTPPVAAASSAPTNMSGLPDTPTTATTTKHSNLGHNKQRSSAAVVRQSQLNQHYQMLNGTSPTKRAVIGGLGAAFKSGQQKAAGPIGFRSLLTQLITLQTDTLSVSRQRLEVEQRRLQFEQSMADKFLSVFSAMAANK